jgi:hypothetical protein
MEMHIFATIGLIVCALLFLVVGLVGVLQDLLVRGPHDVPLLQDPNCERRAASAATARDDGRRFAGGQTECRL